MNNLKPCPFCGATLEQCDESPIYGKSAMHPQADCIFSNNLFFHKDFDILWNKRYEELNNETKRQVSDDSQ